MPANVTQFGGQKICARIKGECPELAEARGLLFFFVIVPRNEAVLFHFVFPLSCRGARSVPRGEISTEGRDQYRGARSVPRGEISTEERGR